MGGQAQGGADNLTHRRHGEGALISCVSVHARARCDKNRPHFRGERVVR